MRHRVPILVVVPFLALLLLAACGNSTNDSDVDTDTDDCDAGPCCDTEKGTFRPDTYECDLWEEYICSGTACGDDAQRQAVHKYCSGSSSSCTGTKVPEGLVVIDDCAPDEKCTSDGISASCNGCGSGSYCDGDYCQFCRTDDHCGESCDDCTSGGQVCGYGGWECIAEIFNDPESGLTWQKTPDAEFWFWDDAKNHCYSLNRAGYEDWRLPTVSELRSLIRGCAATETGGSCGATDDCLDAGCRDSSCDGCNDLEGPGEDGCYWPDWLAGVCHAYWSISSVAGTTSYKWAVGFDDADVIRLEPPSHVTYALCVRGDPLGSACGVDTCIDTASGLEWEKTADADLLDWADARSHCDGLDLAGQTDWRLPTISELRSLIRGCASTETGGSCSATDECLNWELCRNSSCDGCDLNSGPASGCYWPNWIFKPCFSYWSSSTATGESGFSWGIDFQTASIYDYRYSEGSRRFALCVRGGT